MPVLTDDLADVKGAAAVLALGGVVVLLDARAGSGDLVTPARTATADQVNFLAQHGGGLTSLALAAGRVAALGLPPMAARWEQPRKPFAVSIEARHGVTTGISAADRARTIRVAVDPTTRPDDLISPGHVFPLRAHPDGVAALAGRTEAALALAEVAGFGEGAVLTEVLDAEGELARPRALLALAVRLGIPCLDLDAVVKFVLSDRGAAAPPAPPSRLLARPISLAS